IAGREVNACLFVATERACEIRSVEQDLSGAPDRQRQVKDRSGLDIVRTVFLVAAMQISIAVPADLPKIAVRRIVEVPVDFGATQPALYETVLDHRLQFRAGWHPEWRPSGRVRDLRQLISQFAGGGQSVQGIERI